MIKNQFNKIRKEKIKLAKKSLKKSIKLSNKQDSIDRFIILQKLLDKYSKKKIIHRNKCSRLKSIFIKKVNNLR